MLGGGEDCEPALYTGWNDKERDRLLPPSSSETSCMPSTGISNIGASAPLNRGVGDCLRVIGRLLTSWWKERICFVHPLLDLNHRKQPIMVHGSWVGLCCGRCMDEMGKSDFTNWDPFKPAWDYCLVGLWKWYKVAKSADSLSRHHHQKFVKNGQRFPFSVCQSPSNTF